jgi:hypothetical protein
VTYRVTLSAPALEESERAARLLAADEECERRGWRLRALSWQEGWWHAIVDSRAPARAVQSQMKRILGEGCCRSAAVHKLPRARVRDRAVFEDGWKQAAAYFIAGSFPLARR